MKSVFQPVSTRQQPLNIGVCWRLPEYVFYILDEGSQPNDNLSKPSNTSILKAFAGGTKENKEAWPRLTVFTNSAAGERLHLGLFLCLL